MPRCIYPEINRIHEFDLNYLYMTMTLYMTSNTFICTIPFVLSEFSKITFFKDLVRKIIEAKVSENGSFCTFPWLWPQLSPLNKILNDSDRPNRIVQMNGCHVKC